MREALGVIRGGRSISVRAVIGGRSQWQLVRWRARGLVCIAPVSMLYRAACGSDRA